MLEFSSLSTWPIVVGVFINMFIGSFWYSPLGFGKVWSKLSGVNMMDIPKSEANKSIAIVALGAIIQTVALAVIINSVEADTFLQGLVVGLLVWLGFTAATTIGDTLYARRGWNLWWINSSFFLVVFLIDAALLAVWN
ncbi:MAG: DUF1761 domain-containing protein [Patescibacteria group bacterium]|nr:DUF1761 domain-containing protein [Patescibacteria group bacterium]